MKVKKRKRLSEIPAGHKREEERRIRKDTGQAAEEYMADKVKGGTTDLRKIKPDNEIMQHFDTRRGRTIYISKRDPMYVYKWVCFAHPVSSPGMMVYEQLSIPGWEVVQGKDFKEARNLMKVEDGTRKVGDCLLMRCRKDTYLVQLLQERERKLAFTRDVGAIDNVLNTRRQDGAPAFIPKVQPGDDLDSVLKRMHVDQLATAGFVEMLKSGTIPIPNSIERLVRGPHRAVA